MNIVSMIKSDARLKKFVHHLLIKNARPRRWVRMFVTPFTNDKGKGAIIRRRARMDVLPSKKFYIGDHSIIEDFCTVNNGVGDVIIGKNTRIGIGSVVIGPITIGNQVIIAQNIVMSGLNHAYTDVNIPIRLQKVNTALITIEDEAWIGANAVITAGVTIGKHSVVAAGSVVTKDVPPYNIAAGTPAKLIKKYDWDKKDWIKL